MYLMYMCLSHAALKSRMSDQRVVGMRKSCNIRQTVYTKTLDSCVCYLLMNLWYLSYTFTIHAKE